MNALLKGKWITDKEFCALRPRNVFHRQLSKAELECHEHRNRHILFRKKFTLETAPNKAEICITADNYYKLYINGRPICQGPAPSYHSNYNFNRVDVREYLRKGENLIAVHTLYQGLINRVWQSGDNRHGLIFELCADGETVTFSDEAVKTHPHTAYSEEGTVGYDTGFLETYDCTAPEVGFEKEEFDDTHWENASLVQYNDRTLTEQKTKMLCFENIEPVSVYKTENTLLLDFGKIYVGELRATAAGKRGQKITVLCGQELNADGTVRYEMRCNCTYKETWILNDGKSHLDWFDYKAFRYAAFVLEDGVEVESIYLKAHHYPFELKAQLAPQYEHLRSVWDMCIHTQKYGVQESILDCMDREKGFYVGDGCYTALANMVLTGDDSLVHKLIDDAFYSSFITDGLVTCLNCSFMQEIAEYPLILVSLVLWHYKLSGDKEYLRKNYPKVCFLLESYRRDYEKEGLLCDLDKWCVVEWPANYRHGYDVNITEGEICREKHISINAYYINAIKLANEMAEILECEPYRETENLEKAFNKAFFDEEKHLFKDSESSSHISLVGNIFPYAFGLCPDERTVRNITEMLRKEKISSLSLFCSFLALSGLKKYGEAELLAQCLADENAWLNMLSEGATATFECFSKDGKWNTSLFHMTFSYAAIFLCAESCAIF